MIRAQPASRCAIGLSKFRLAAEAYWKERELQGNGRYAFPNNFERRIISTVIVKILKDRRSYFATVLHCFSCIFV